MTTLTLDEIDQLTHGRIGTFDTPCPFCSPYRRPRNQRLKVFRIYRIDDGFAGYHCVHCGESGHTRQHDDTRPDPAKLAKARAEAAERERQHRAMRLNKARWLWRQRLSIQGTIAERYLRDRRGITCDLPATLGFLPARDGYAPAMIAAFGMASEIPPDLKNDIPGYPGVIAIDSEAVAGVHLTRLLPDGSDRERGDQAKIMVGRSLGSPIVLAAPNDLLGMAIAEGIESALSAHQATGLGAWAAGSASRMPQLADRIPAYIECVTVVADDDEDGRRFAGQLAAAIDARGIEVMLT